ncbi:MAG: hypothetical protein RMN25_04120 [Anaerolineae bacterium]|nr:hypothetical protein [Thermoflexales bacterium]MDW8406949.1 hypothetical protein [Anaerolineae bacterium]
MSSAWNPVTGTTAPIYVPASDSPKTVELGKSYFWLQIKAAQAYFADDSFFRQYFGFSLDKIKNIVVTSKITLDTAALMEAAHGLKHVRELKRGVPELLGLSPNLINLTPAIMTSASVSLEMLVDTENQLAKLAGMINSDSLFTPLSLSPGTLAVAKAISTLAQKTIQAFIPPNEQKPILQFEGNFNFAGGAAPEGYYVILGTRDASAPLPPPAAKLEVQGNALLIDGQPANRLSYVILELRTAPARTRAAGAGSPWEAKLSEAEREAQLVGEDPFADDDRRRTTWERVITLLREASILLSADPNYLPDEATHICRACYEQCKQALVNSQRAIEKQFAAPWVPDEAQSRAALHIPESIDLTAELEAYQRDTDWVEKHVAQLNVW